MDIYEAIAQRRSIRRYKKDQSVPRELVDKLLDAAIKSPSACNRQPWQFIVLDGAKKAEFMDIFNGELARMKEAGEDTGSGPATARSMGDASTLILVYDPLWHPEDDRTGHNRTEYLMDTQSAGAAIQNLLLAATAEGLGTLWIGDTFLAEEAIGRWLGRNDEMVGAIAIGWPDQAPSPRPRKPRDTVVDWAR